jgi:transcriptional regulator with XRE-family HTH domain
VDAARTLRRARLDAGLSLRDLAGRARTSHATLAAYEAGRTIPRVDTLDRILRAAGFASDITTTSRPDATDAERETKGRELLQVLDLAAHVPARHDPHITLPPFPTAAADA